MDFFERVAELRARTRARSRSRPSSRAASPVSSHLGDRAIVLADGRMEGFVGGSCSRDIVRRQGARAIRTRHAAARADSSRAAPEPTTSIRPGPSSCRWAARREGAVDVYIEPHLPPRRLIVVGFTPVAETLARLGATLEGIDVTRVVAATTNALTSTPIDGRRIARSTGSRERLAAIEAPASARALVAVVASQGHYDEAALEVLLAARARVRRSAREPQARRDSSTARRSRRRSPRSVWRACATRSGSTSARARRAKSRSRSSPQIVADARDRRRREPCDRGRDLTRRIPSAEWRSRPPRTASRPRRPPLRASAARTADSVPSDPERYATAGHA